MRDEDAGLLRLGFVVFVAMVVGAAILWLMHGAGDGRARYAIVAPPMRAATRPHPPLVG